MRGLDSGEETDPNHPSRADAGGIDLGFVSEPDEQFRGALDQLAAEADQSQNRH
jgi:hypothetical protein